MFFNHWKNHVVIIAGVNSDNITIQDGNDGGVTNTFKDAKKDLQTNTYTLEQLNNMCVSVVFANPK